MKTGVFNLKLSKLKLYNYRCFGDVEQVIDINNITAFIGNLRVKSSIIKNNSSVWIYGIFKLPHLRKIQTPRKELFHV